MRFAKPDEIGSDLMEQQAVITQNDRNKIPGSCDCGWNEHRVAMHPSKEGAARTSVSRAQALHLSAGEPEPCSGGSRVHGDDQGKRF